MKSDVVFGKKVGLLAFIVGLAACGSAQELWTGNYHSYQVVAATGGINWSDASNAASSLGGYLASVRSGPENDFIFTLIDHPSAWTLGPNGASLGPWIGGFQPPGVEPGGWQWTSGESFPFSSWAPGEPNQSGGMEEDYIHYFQEGFGRSRTWNDLSNNGTSGMRPKAYVVEFDRATVTIQVTLLDYLPSPAGKVVQVELIQNNATVGAQNVTLGAGGFGTFTTTVVGPTEIVAKTSHWLRRRLASVTLGGGQTMDVQFSLTNGDVDHDNEVAIGDYAQLSAAYGTSIGDPGWNSEADLNGDEEVGISDFAILSQNYGLFGD